jgi:divalent metal cation (Fe/Co/Zn/Cd) transporter
MHRDRQLTRALRLSWLSVGFGAVFGSVSIAAGIADHSLGVLAAGLSVLADVTGSVVLIWRFRVERTDPGRAHEVEDRAAIVVAIALLAIGVILCYESVNALLSGTHPGSSLLAILTAALSFCVLAPLAYAKRVTAISLHSHALKGDSTLSAIGASTALFALVGLALNSAFGWWWADRVVALLIAGAAVIEAREVITAERAED